MPALLTLLLTPLLLYYVFPPEIKETPEAPALAEKKLQVRGLKPTETCESCESSWFWRGGGGDGAEDLSG